MSENYENLAFYGVLLVFKVMIMSLVTSKTRYKNGALRSPEDAQFRLGTTDWGYLIKNDLSEKFSKSYLVSNV